MNGSHRGIVVETGGTPQRFYVWCVKRCGWMGYRPRYSDYTYGVCTQCGGEMERSPNHGKHRVTKER